MKVIFKPWLLLTAVLLLILVTIGITPCQAGDRSTPLRAGDRLTPLTERTYLHTDREMYIAGDYLFFKIYVVDNSSLHLTWKSKLAYISIRNKDNHIIVNERVNLQGGLGHSSIYLPDTLSTGYYQLQAFTNCMRNEGEACYFTKEIFITNRFDRELAPLSEAGTPPAVTKDTNHINPRPATIVSPVGVATDKKSYRNREKISLSLHMDGTGLSTLTNLSVSVFEQPPQQLPNRGIDEYFKFTATATSGSPMDQGVSHASSCKYLPEMDGQILQGKVTDATDETMIPNVLVFLSTIDTTVNLKYAMIDTTTGTFRFLLDSYYDNKELNFKIHPITRNVQKFKVLFDDKFTFLERFTPACFNDTAALRNFISKSQNITKIHKVYHSKLNLTDNPINASSLNLPSAQVYTKPAYCVRPSEFLSLPDFFEITTELLPNLRVRKKQGKIECNYLDISENKYFEGSPLVFVDGILIDNVSQVIHLNSTQIDRIDCIGRQRALGNLTFDGILAVFTKKKETDSIQLFNNIRLATGYPLLPSRYYTPDYGTTNDPFIPDYRQLLYWNPDVVIKGNTATSCDFFASDQSGRYVIKVEGITSDGKTVDATTYINIESSEK